ncbi:MAG: LLM class flavin-dependent oxidoreductase [Chloroflexota bacterium]|nr:LLM class flavin-dependent oxidoreductase [Dehalococcoidia bacterium]MDW8255272.1 LLM class flavin-dependent oxidoreductase [Chloroflexota bacterium]
MHFSLYINPQTSGPDDDLKVIRAVTQHIEYADQNGFDAVYLTEHHTTGYNAFADPFMFGAYLANRIRRMTLGFSVAVLPFHHPLRFATHCNLLDNFYEGRFIAGFGTGNSPLEYEAFGIPLEEKREIVNEAIEVVLGCWRGNYEHHGKYFNVKVERVIPAPYTKPHPKVARAVTSDESLVDTARRGWPVLLGRFPEQRIKQYVDRYREVLEASNHPDDVIRYCLDWVTVLKLVYLAESEEQAYEELRPSLVRYLIQAAKANSSDYILEEQANEQAEEFIARAMIVGTPKQAIERIESYAHVGVRNMMIWTAFGSMPHEQTFRTLRLFAEEVMPHFQRVPAGVR